MPTARHVLSQQWIGGPFSEEIKEFQKKICPASELCGPSFEAFSHAN
jgi:hypothetical protein